MELEYKLIDDGTFCVCACHGDAAVVEIPAALDGVPVTVIADGVFRGHAELCELRMAEGITDLGEFVFDGCENLRQLQLPASLERFWGYSFARCGLEELTIPDRVRSIPPFCFKDCKNLTRLKCGSGMQTIYAWAFAGCDKLTDLDIGPSVKLHPQAFASKDLNT
ncbi:MAG: leucine-rich repeat domain-containing protein [Oscillospiraceae bacterium]|nr:leucine-rich repeat domain-containing protein [Oscillospiraceae bacterium]